ncbi:hypothetical protein BK781_19955 [Bacillus thuringiensis serovar aizawai]|nr:hypothetical protein BK781_19955 [Bacillus thuringiensis serovar aizawai]
MLSYIAKSIRILYSSHLLHHILFISQLKKHGIKIPIIVILWYLQLLTVTPFLKALSLKAGLLNFLN